ncbi:MAG TPA: sporulation protein cse60 [Firmicutes bacterium]|nr:sporulation protein cse60 [Bacillota bacterium]
MSPSCYANTSEIGGGLFMSLQIKCFDEDTEVALEEKVNEFLKTLTADKVVDIKFAVSHFEDHEDRDQVFSFCAMVIYKG